MNPAAVDQARARLSKAEKALEAFKAATDVATAEEAWTDFLVAAGTVYSKLEQGAKGYGKSEGWFGRKKKERKDDPLLRYLHYARNSNEHGIQRVAATTKDNTWQGRKLKFNERIPVQMRFEDEERQRQTGRPYIDGVFAGPTLKPVRAVDTRFNDSCDPPKTHMGAEIKYSDFVDGLATAAIPYLRSLVSEADGLAKGTSKDIAK